MMNREEFLKELEFLLQDIDEEERIEALNYYNDYFDEAGKENEWDVIRELVSPERVAATIKSGLDSNDNYEFNEKGIDDGYYYEKRHGLIEKFFSNNGNYNERNNKILKLIIIVLIALILLPVGGGIGGLFLGFIALLFGIIGVGFFGTIGLLCGAIALVVVAIRCLVGSMIGSGLLLIGIALLLVSLSYLTSLVMKVIVNLLPKIYQMIIDFIRRIFNKEV